MKKALMAIVALLAFSMLSTSVSANKPYYMASFYGEAEGCCWVATGPGEPKAGKGSFYIRGLAVVNETEGGYFAGPYFEPNTRLWTRRTRMTLSWDNKKLTVWMWPSYEAVGLFNDTLDLFIVYNMSYFGYYKGEAGLEFIWGRAVLYFQSINGAEPVSVLQMMLVQGIEPFLQVYWLGGELPGPPPGCVARSVIHRVTVWGPIPWHPSGPIY